MAFWNEFSYHGRDFPRSMVRALLLYHNKNIAKIDSKLSFSHGAEKTGV